MKEIFIITDHKWRDLPANVYLKNILEYKYGHRVRLIHLGDERILAPVHHPKMVVYNNLYSARSRRYAQHLHEKNIAIVILPTEGITFSEEQTVLFSHKYCDVSFIDAYISWNNLMKDALIKYSNINPKKIYVAGNGRFDFYSPKMKVLRKSRKYYSNLLNVDFEKKNILIATNFPTADFHGQVSLLEKNLKEQQGHNTKGFDAKSMANHEDTYRNKVFRLIRLISSKFSEVNILIKPHPSENISVYESFIKSLSPHDNVLLIKGEYIWDLINISDAIIQRSSTVAIEGWLLRKDTIELDFMDSNNHFLKPMYKEGSIVVENEDALCAALYRVFSESYQIPQPLIEKRQKIIEYVSEGNDGNATERIATHINSLLDRKDECGLPAFLDKKEYFKFFIKKYLGNQTYERIRGMKNMKWGDYLGRFDTKFTHDDVKEWSCKLRELVH